LPSSLIIAIFSLLSRILGVLRNNLLASTFGAIGANATSSLDSYYAAFRVPDLIYNLLIAGTISAAFIPIFSAYLNKRSKKEAFDFANSLLNILFILLLAIAFVAFIFAPQMIRCFTIGFAPEKTAITIKLTRVMLLSPIFFGLSSFFGSILNSFKRFFFYSLAPVLYNLGIIFGILVLTPRFGLFGVAYGVLIGAFLHLVNQFLAAYFQTGFRYRPILRLRDNDLKKIGKLVVPRILGLSADQINLITDTLFGSMLVAGSVTVLNLANDLQQLALGIVSVSLAIAVFPVLADLFNQERDDEFKVLVQDKIRQILFLIIPMAVGLLILRIQVVRLIYGYGKFGQGWASTVTTASTLGAYVVSYPAAALIPILARSFYARQNTMIPLITSFIAVVINIVLDLLFMRPLGVAGLALATSIALIVNFVLLLTLLSRQLKKFDYNDLFWSVGKIAVISLIMAGFIQLGKNIIGILVNMDTIIGVFLQLAISCGLGAAAYLGFSYLFRSQELRFFLKKIKKKI